jgi:hypothetical protein
MGNHFKFVLVFRYNFVIFTLTVLIFHFKEMQERERGEGGFVKDRF